MRFEKRKKIPKPKKHNMIWALNMAREVFQTKIPMYNIRNISNGFYN